MMYVNEILIDVPELFLRVPSRVSGVTGYALKLSVDAESEDAVKKRVMQRALLEDTLYYGVLAGILIVILYAFLVLWPALMNSDAVF